MHRQLVGGDNNGEDGSRNQEEREKRVEQQAVTSRDASSRCFPSLLRQEVCMLLLVRCLVLVLRALFAKRRLDLALENVALRHQLEVLARTRKRAPIRSADRVLWSWLARIWPRWRRHLVLVRPETVVRWTAVESPDVV